MCIEGVRGDSLFSAQHIVCYLFDLLIILLFAAFVRSEFLIVGCLRLIPTRAKKFYLQLLSSVLDKKILSQGIHTQLHPKWFIMMIISI